MMRLAGKQTFTLTPGGTRGIQWQVDREEIDEAGGAPIFTRNVATTVEATATFDLPKIEGKETFYHINVRGPGFTDKQRVQVFQPDRRSSFLFRSPGNPDVRTYIVVPSTLNSSTRVVFVMHGIGRNADEYLDSWLEWASSNNYIALAPAFDEDHWKSSSYILGNVFTRNNGGGEKNPESKWSFSVVELLHLATREGFALADKQYDIFGHSAGAQFVHRFLLFKPRSNVRLALAANAGWYTLPDETIDFAYGVKHPLLSFTRQELIAWTNRRMILMHGTADIQRDRNLSVTPQADAQGKNRYERATYMFTRARALNPRTRWRLVDVPGADHDQKKMAPAAQVLLREFISAVSNR